MKRGLGKLREKCVFGILRIEKWKCVRLDSGVWDYIIVLCSLSLG